DDVVKSIDEVRRSLREFNRLEFPQSTQKLKVESMDELGDLKRQFNALQEKAERYYEELAQEMELAHRVQTSLLPASLIRQGNVSVEGISNGAADLGGDFFDVALVGHEEIIVFIGDVSGKGIPASLVTATVLGLFRAEIQYGGTPSHLLNRLNRSMNRLLMSDMYVTAGILWIDTNQGSFRYAGAGHLPPLLVRAGEISEWETASLPLGYGQEAFTEIRGVFTPGDALVLYTDGVIEARTETGEIVGFERLKGWIIETLHQSNDVLKGIYMKLENHRSGQNRQDDETLVVLRYGCDKPDKP
ncbi:MAG: serine/threonine-protein phosphatase, partial [Thermicanus sp.]|nr:serine/threonine-protein phosphatase [Thermicanus sp.]